MNGENMNYKLTIAILIAIIIVLIIGLITVMPNFHKEDSKIIMTSSASLYENESITIELKDSNNNPIANAQVSIVFKDQNGDLINKTLTTDTLGIGYLSLNGLSTGNYNVTIIFGGNDKFSNSSLFTNLEIKEIVKVQQSSTSSSSSSSSSIGPDVDSGGITREQAEEFGYTYTTDHGGHYIGPNDRWDENAGVYHD